MELALSSKFVEMNEQEKEVVNGGGLEDLGNALIVALGAAGTVVLIAAIPFTKGTSGAAAVMTAGTTMAAWGRLTD